MEIVKHSRSATQFTCTGTKNCIELWRTLQITIVNLTNHSVLTGTLIVNTTYWKFKADLKFAVYIPVREIGR